ncbi:MAG: YceI family protein [Kofleriaceae bacterium]
MPRSPYLLTLVPGLALAGAGARWALQGSGNLYTAIDKRFYVADPDLGYRVAGETPLWLGLDAVAVLLAITLGVLGAAWFIRRRERRRAPWPLARWVVGLGSAVTLAVPAYAFATGAGPSGGLEALPQGQIAAPPTAGVEGQLPAPAGRYQIVAHAGTAITARVSAGKEEFDALRRRHHRSWQGDPGDLTAPMSAEATVPVAAVDTGNPLRSKHAREEYLGGGVTPTLGFRLGELRAARQDGPDVVVFRAAATLVMKGVDHPVEVTGSLRVADAAARARLGTQGPTLIVSADTELSIKQSALASDADSFDSDRLPLHVSLVLVHAPS